MEPLSLEDVRAVESQIGRPPRGFLGVERRCPHGYPQVVRVYPLIDGKPFPTIFWLTCPFLVAAIDRLETGGEIKRTEGRLASDPALAARFEETHRGYIEEREALLSSGDRAFLEGRGMLASLHEKGIGGTADFRRVKCLHLHVAHALVRENPVGALVLDYLRSRACPPQQVICSARTERSRSANDRRSS